MNVGIYCRISADKVGAGLGVARQRADCEELARGHGWTVTDVYVDNDVSAYSGKTRHQYRRLLADAASGRINAIVSWHTDRLHRSPRELEEFIDICEAHKVRVETVRAGELDLKTPAGRAVARTLGAWARYESEHRSERIRRKSIELAQRGLPHMGGKRYYGYAGDRVTIVGEEAAILREAASRVLAGESLRAICVDLNERGVATVTGRKWSTPRLKQTLLAPHRAGLIEHHTAGRIIGSWPAIFSTDERARLVAVLTDPVRRVNRGAPRRRLLSGILDCGECGAKLVGSEPRSYDTRRRSQYRCMRREHKGCGKIAIARHLVDPYIVEAVLGTLEQVQVSPDDTDDRAELTDLAADEQQLHELASLYATRTITAPEWIRARAEIEERIGRRKTQLAETTIHRQLGDLVSTGTETIRTAWPDLPLDKQRAIVSAVLDRVIVRKAMTSRFFDPSRLEPIWRV